MSATVPTGPGNRGVSPVAAVRPKWLTKRNMLFGIAGFTALGLSWMFWVMEHPPEPKTIERLPEKLGVVGAYQPIMLTQPPPPPAPTAVPDLLPKSAFMPGMQYTPPPRFMPQTPPAAPSPPATQTPAATPPAPSPPSAPAAPNMALMPAVSPKPYMLTYAEPSRPPENPGANAAGNGKNDDPATLASNGQAYGVPSIVSYKKSSISGTQAGLMGDQTYVLPAGLMPCILDTRIDSTLVGPIECHLPADIKPRGITLLSRWSRVHGMYGNALSNGQARLPIAASWVEDLATGCAVQFDAAGMSDMLGTTGIAGSIDHHYLERFGPAMLLTAGQSGLNLAQAILSKGGNTYLSVGQGGGGGGIESLAMEMLRKQETIADTHAINQGTPIAVFVPHPIDFSKCFKLTLKDR